MNANAAPEYALNYHFDFRRSKDLNPGDSLPSSIPPTDSTHKDHRVIVSPAGFPIPLSLHLVYLKPSYEYWLEGRDQFLLQLRLHQTSQHQFIPPLYIQPLCLPTDRKTGANRLDRRLLGIHQPASWAFSLAVEPIKVTGRPNAGPIERLAPVDIPTEVSGHFRFQLLDEPAHLISALPPSSSVDCSCLPADMICAVLKELPLADRVNARLVCKAWTHVLDKDSRAWKDITYLQSQPSHDESQAEGPYDYHQGRLNLVRDSNVSQALGFLASRGAPISTLELMQGPISLFYELEDLPSKLTELGITLKALAFRGNCREFEEDGVRGDAALLILLRSQSQLETLHLELGPAGVTPTLLPPLPNLRILSLLVSSQHHVDAFRNLASVLQGLDGLRLCMDHSILELVPEYPEYDPDIAGLTDDIQELGLKRLAAVDWPKGTQAHCGCWVHFQGFQVVWGTANLSPGEAATLLHPNHYSGVHRRRLSCHFRI